MTLFFFGGRNDIVANLEGRLLEIAVYHRALGGYGAAAQYRAA